MALKDKLGQFIHAGSYVAYGQAEGRNKCAAIRIGRVTKINKEKSSLTIQGVAIDAGKKELALVTPKRTMFFYDSDRIIVLFVDQLSDAYLNLLEDLRIEE